MPKKIEIHEYPDVPAMDCWHYIAPLIPVNGDPMSITIYVNTFHAFQLLEKEKQDSKNE